MSEHGEPTEEHDLYEEVPPRSIFAATWFRVLLVVIVIGVIGAVAIPYVLDFMNPPPSRPATAGKSPSPPAVPPMADKAVADAPPVATPVTPPSAPVPVESKPAPPPARAAEPKPATPKAPAAPADKTKTAMVEATPKPASTKPAAKAAAKPAVATKETSEAKPDTGAKAETAKATAADAAKPATASKPAPAAKRAAATASTTTGKPPAGTGSFWVQVGAFKDAETAKRVAAKLREDNFNVEESLTKAGGAPVARSAPKPVAAATAPAKTPDAGADQYDVFVSGLTPEELNKRLAAKGLAAEASGAGAVVKPSLPLRDAVALSKDLAVEGFKVQVRRAGGSMGSVAPPPATATATATAPAPSALAAVEGGAELHRVRVGSFADRAAAQEALRQLEAKGYKPYIARGDH